MKAGIGACRKYEKIVDEYIERAYRGEHVSFEDLCNELGVLPHKHCFKVLVRARYGDFFENLVDDKRFGWRIVAFLEYIARNDLDVFLETVRTRGVQEAFKQVFGDWVGTSGWYNFMRRWFGYTALMDYSDIYAEIISLRLKGYMILDEEQYRTLTSVYDLARHGYYIYRFMVRRGDKQWTYYVVAVNRLGKFADKTLKRMVYAELRKRHGEDAEIMMEPRRITSA